MDRLIIIEGLPGSGKTTLAARLTERLRSEGLCPHTYLEGDLHPADMAWCALLTQETFEGLCARTPSLAGALRQNARPWNGRVILAYTRVDGMSDALAREMEACEVYDGRSGEKLFRDAHQSLWASFGAQAAGIHVFECALMQNAVNELTLFYQASEQAVGDYMAGLLISVSRLRPIIVYLNMDADAAIGRAAAERVDENGCRTWEARVAKYVAQSPYGQARGAAGVADMMEYFRARAEMEKRLLIRLPSETIRVDVTPACQPQVTEALLDDLVNRLKA